MTEENSLEILDPIAVDVNTEEVIERMKIRKVNPDLRKMVERVVKNAREIARPKAVYKTAYIKECKGDNVVIDDVQFTSRVLAVNLKEVHRVFPLVITAGVELDVLTPETDNFMEQYVIDIVKQCYLSKAGNHLKDHIKTKYGITHYGYMEPGSLSSWPVQQQKELFQLLGKVEEMIGVRLTESFMMRPLKSVSGILYPTKVDFQTCMLCPRENCPDRKAPYDPEMLKSYNL